MLNLKTNFNLGKSIFRENTKKIITIVIATVTIISNSTVAFAAGTFVLKPSSNSSGCDYKQNVTEKEVSYSIIDAMKNKDYSNFDKHADTNEVYIGTLPEDIKINDNNLLVNESRVLAYIQKSPLTAYGCTSTVESLLSRLNPDKNANNSTYWSATSGDYIVDDYLMGHYYKVDFDSWNKNNHNGFLVSFKCYEKTRVITLKVTLNTESIIDCGLTDGQTVKLFNELQKMSTSNGNLTISKVNNKGWYKTTDGNWSYSENGVDVTGWKYINNAWYYFYSDGIMAKFTFINGYWVNNDGSYRK
jgi:hypothetical protein